MVMIVFTLRSHDYVFKVIRDRFAHPKTTTHEDVRRRYQLVFEHDRAGRLIEAQEFESLSFDRWRFAPELLDELLTGAARNVELEGERVTLRHVYVERRVEPLNLFLRRAPRESALRAVHEYGQALRDLARTNIFPGDLLLKNFGVTRHGRVTFYDYDELCLVTECRFRDLPDDEDGLSAEPGFYVGERDVFPEEFLSFLGLVGEQRAAFLADHAEILTSAFWRDLKRRHEAGEVIDVFPYPPGRSLGARATGTGPETPPSPSGPAERTPGASD
jgi:isocitrate dehydrogenase kinase/phosphatase